MIEGRDLTSKIQLPKQLSALGEQHADNRSKSHNDYPIDGGL